MAKKNSARARLGRGLDDLLSGSAAEEGFGPAPGGGIDQIPLDQIRPNPFQPREEIGGEQIEDLVNSIREHGVLQPVIVRRADDGYELIAGERRWRASQQAGLETVPAIVRDVTDDDALTLALVENIQREDLNDVEKGRAFREMGERFGLTQEEIARRTGKGRSTIANYIRLLELPDAILELVSRGTISGGHARALLGLASDKARLSLCKRIVRQDLSVREVERLVSQRRDGASVPGGPKASAKAKPAHIRDLEDRMRERLGLRVALEVRASRGKATVYFANDTEFQHLLDTLDI